MRRATTVLAALAAAIGAIGAPALAHGADPGPRPRRDGLTALGAARFDGTRTAIAIPYAGRAPRPILYRISATRYYYEFEGARFEPGGAQYRKLDSNLARFTISNRPARPVVRVAFRLTQPAIPAVRVDAATRTIEVLPLGRATALGTAPAKVPHGLALPLPDEAATR